MSGLSAHCYLLSKDHFNEINIMYDLNLSFDSLETSEVVNNYYLYKQYLIMTGLWYDYDYYIYSADYTNLDKTEILIVTTRITNSNVENNIATDNISYSFVKKDGMWHIKSIDVN